MASAPNVAPREKGAAAIVTVKRNLRRQLGKQWIASFARPLSLSLSLFRSRLVERRALPSLRPSGPTATRFPPPKKALFASAAERLYSQRPEMAHQAQFSVQGAPIIADRSARAPLHGRFERNRIARRRKRQQHFSGRAGKILWLNCRSGAEAAAA